MASEREKTLLKVFVRAYNKDCGTTYAITEWPEETERAKRSASPKKAIEALAVDSGCRRLALEHTTIEAFEKAIANDHKFKPLITFFRDPSARLPGHHIVIYMCVDSMDGLSQSEREVFASEFRNWFDKVKDGLPEGMSERSVPFGNPQPTVEFCKRRLQADHLGLITVQRYPQPKPEQRLQRAIDEKMPKLQCFPADDHILLLERQDYDTQDFWSVRDVMERIMNPHKATWSSEVWLADTSKLIFGDCAANGPYVNFHHAWPIVNDRSFSERVNEDEVEIIKRER